jgi:hypothetical protein
MIRLLYKQEQDNRVNVIAETGEGGSITYTQDMPWSVRKVLDMYKECRIG